MARHVAERDVRLVGEDAVAWLRGRGYRLRSHVRPLHLFADEMGAGPFAMRRMWSSGFDAGWRVPGADGVVSATLLVDGEIGMRTDAGDVLAVHAGSLLVWRSGREVVWSSRQAAVIQLECELSRLFGVVDVLDVEGRPLPVDPAVRLPLVALVTSVLDSGVTPAHHGFAGVQRALEAMVAAALLEHTALPAYRGSSAAEGDLFRRATAFILSHADDPSLTLGSIADALNVSAPYLTRVFRSSGLTPIRFLRRVRAANASALLGTDALPGDVDAVARQVGFSNARNMRRAIRNDL